MHEAIFSLPTGLHVAQADTSPELRNVFAPRVAVVPPGRGAETVTETFRATFQGLAQLDRSGRTRQARAWSRRARMERVTPAVRCVVQADWGYSRASSREPCLFLITIPFEKPECQAADRPPDQDAAILV